jgi:rhodanese-related sulfurtransferase
MPKEVDRHEVQRLIDQGAQLVDVLGPSEYEHSHLPGAVNIPLGKLADRARDDLDDSRPVVTYCYDTLCDMSPRAAWRLEALGFGDVYDYVGSKMDWIGAGLPFEGEAADRPRLATLADSSVPTCALDDKVGELRDRIGAWEVCVVVNDARVVLGVVRAEVVGLEADRTVVEVMNEAPKTYRPHFGADDVLPDLDKKPTSWVLVTNLNGTLVGIVRPDQLREVKADSDG